MKVDVDFLISLMTKYTTSTSSEEIGEQETADAGASAGGTSSSTGGGGKNNVTTWSQIVGAQLKRGHANPLGNTKWESGLTRGAANQLT